MLYFQFIQKISRSRVFFNYPEDIANVDHYIATLIRIQLIIRSQPLPDSVKVYSDKFSSSIQDRTSRTPRSCMRIGKKAANRRFILLPVSSKIFLFNEPCKTNRQAEIAVSCKHAFPRHQTINSSERYILNPFTRYSR